METKSRPIFQLKITVSTLATRMQRKKIEGSHDILGTLSPKKSEKWRNGWGHKKNGQEESTFANSETPYRIDLIV